MGRFINFSSRLSSEWSSKQKQAAAFECMDHTGDCSGIVDSVPPTLSWWHSGASVRQYADAVTEDVRGSDVCLVDCEVSMAYHIVTNCLKKGAVVVIATFKKSEKHGLDAKGGLCCKFESEFHQFREISDDRFES
jgi:hypothetical protein